MKTNFPKIYSLSTLGVIQHFNCDYRFHTIRTDFTGEGGSGKSMVADMLQAIFVGSGAYESSTKGNDDRPLEGMVLKPKGQQFGLSYIFLNIQMGPMKFLVIGIYLESSSRHAQSFIIQSGYNWDGDLNAIASPVFYKDLLVNGKIAPIEKLPEELSTRNLVIKSLSIKKYHQLLYHNCILPIDLSCSKATLDSYANILRSFSRGKSFKKDSDTLKDFLFGDEDESALMQQYKAEVKSISDDYLEHSRLKGEIDLIHKKQNLIKDVFDRKKEHDKKQKEYLKSKVLYYLHQQELSLKKIKEISASYVEISIEKSLIEKREIELLIKEIKEQNNLLKKYRTEFQDANNKIQTLQTNKEECEKNYQENIKEKTVVDMVDQWLKNFGTTNEAIKEAYQSDKAKREQKNQLQIFIKHLEQHKFTTSFEQSEWLVNFQKAEEKYEAASLLAIQKITSLNTLEVFSNLNNPDSLAAWAINYFTKALSLEEESTLMHFQSFPRVKPADANGKRYLPFPENLFEKLKIKDSLINGFWLDLDGVYEFINFVPRQYFKTNNFDELRDVMKNTQRQVSEELKYVKYQKDEADQLKGVLFKFTGLESVIKLYKNKQEILNFQPEPSFSISEDDLDNYFKTYEDRSIVLNNFDKAKSDYEKAVKSEVQNQDSIKNLNNKIVEIECFFQKKQIAEDQIPPYVESQNEQLSVIDSEIGDIQSEFGLDVNKVEFISNKLFQEINEKNLEEVIRAKPDYIEKYYKISRSLGEIKTDSDTIDDSLNKAKQEYQAGLKTLFSNDENIKDNWINPDEGTDSLKNQYDKAQADFHAKYEVAVEELDDKAQLSGTYDVGQLAHKLLPKVFESSHIKEDLIDQKIADRLESVNRTIREIGSRKIEILKKVISEVYKTYNGYLTKINQIDNYFKSTGKVITGGNRASLKYTKSNNYPDRWMGPFRKQLEDQLNNIGLFKELQQEMDINVMMKKAFVAAGGSEKVTPEDLLNPKSYFNLTFNLKLESGDNNAGSNGQTYTATALLGIARLSIIEKDENNKKRDGVRFMPIDEAEGLGSNYDTLCKIAKEEDYQIISMSIEPAGELKHGEQYVYIMNENTASDADCYVPPFGIFSEGEITENIGDFVYNGDKGNE